MLSLIAAMSLGRVIGANGVMPWHMPADLKWFKQHTLGKPVVMGRKTWESIGKALPGRRNIVVSRAKLLSPDIEQVSTPTEALRLVQHEHEIMIIGGGQLYESFLPQADRLYLTLIQTDLAGDTFFPDYSIYAWQELERHEWPADERHPYPATFLILQRQWSDEA